MRRSVILGVLLVLPACAGSDGSQGMGGTPSDSPARPPGVADAPRPSVTADPRPSGAATSSATYGIRVADTLTVRNGPGTQFAAIGALGAEDEVMVVCSTEGEPIASPDNAQVTRWDRISSPVSGYVAGAFVDTGGVDPDVEDCQDVPGSPDPSPTTPGDLEVLALQAQYLFGGAGGFAASVCAKVPSPSKPDVWIEAGGGPDGMVNYGLLDGVRLCLTGFAPDAPITLDASTPEMSFSTQAVPAGSLPSDPFAKISRHTLFEDGQRLQVFTFDEAAWRAVGEDPAFRSEDPGYLRSQDWTLAPAPEVRDAIADAGTVTLRAVQGDTVAQRTVDIGIGPWSSPIDRIDGPVDDGRLLIVGFEEGVTVPIGLYRLGPDRQLGVLVRHVGSVTMPASRVAEFAPPPGLPSGDRENTYCVVPPVDAPTGFDCSEGRVE